MKEILSQEEMLGWLRETDTVRLEELWRMADDSRRSHVGNAVHLRGLIEISNFCIRGCAYCGLRANNDAVVRYRMTADEILDAARQAVSFGYGTVVLQGGEDFDLTKELIADIIRRIKSELPLAVTLSLGERTEEELRAWRDAGADRYLLRFETSDLSLFRKIHPSSGSRTCDRIALLKLIKQIGYEAGSGIMVGLPGQTYGSVLNDILLFRELDLDMIGIGPFIPHPETPLGSGSFHPVIDPDEQVPNTELMVYKAVALTRLIRSDANIPATSALATINKRNGRELGLKRGANVFMPNLTPLKYRKHYEIYPAKACIDETGATCNGCLTARIQMIGRHIGRGAGGRSSHGNPPDSLHQPAE